MPGFHIPVNLPECSEYVSAPVRYGPRSDVEYARKNRWFVEFSGSPRIADIQLYASKCTRSVVESDVIKVHHGQEEIYRPGKVKWNPVDVTFYEYTAITTPITNAVNVAADRLNKWFAKTMILLEESRRGELSDFLMNCDVYLLDGVGGITWKYGLKECWPVKIASTDLDYASGDIGTTTVTLHYNKVVEEAK